nr:hypothetical protein [uncultured Brevundimonas sp.]
MDKASAAANAQGLMKHAVLTSVAHNLTDSFAGGAGFMIGVYAIDIWAAVAETPSRQLDIDFLTGECNPATSDYLARAVQLYARALPDLCRRQGVNITDFAELTAHFSGAPPLHRIEITVTDRLGRTSNDAYFGAPLKRRKVLDVLGRLRPA